MVDSKKKVKRIATGKVEYDGEVHYTVGVAAKMLKTNTIKVKNLMASRDLEWRNFRDNGPLFISQVSILDYQRRLLAEKRKEHVQKN